MEKENKIIKKQKNDKVYECYKNICKYYKMDSFGMYMKKIRFKFNTNFDTYFDTLNYRKSRENRKNNKNKKSLGK